MARSNVEIAKIGILGRETRLMDDVWEFAGFFKFFQVAENGKKRRKKGEMYIIIYRMFLGPV
jgi:hypothetical protein